VTPPTRTRFKSKTDTHISHSSGKVFKKPSFPQGFLGKTVVFGLRLLSKAKLELMRVNFKLTQSAMVDRKWGWRIDCLMVGARGFEPPTSRSQTERTTRLCYAPNCEVFKAYRRRCILRAKIDSVKWANFLRLEILACLRGPLRDDLSCF
jgi:hypothetical protein